MINQSTFALVCDAKDLGFFVTIDLQPAVDNALHRFNRLSILTKQCTQISIIKTWLYGWTTSTRFGNYHQPCPLCHQLNSDTLRHYYNCHPLTTAAKHTLNQPHLPTTRNFFFSHAITATHTATPNITSYSMLSIYTALPRPTITSNTTPMTTLPTLIKLT